MDTIIYKKISNKTQYIKLRRNVTTLTLYKI